MTAVLLDEAPVLPSVVHRAADIEHIDPDEGTVLMRAAPYDHEVQLDRGLFESFAPATFSRAAAAPHRVKLWHLHDGPLIGHATEVVDKSDGVWVRAKFSNTLNAQEARELAKDGSLDQCSVTFRPMRDWYTSTKQTDGWHIRHSRAYLLGVALVPHGAYDAEAYIAETRDISATAAADLVERQRLERIQRVNGWAS